MALTEADIDKIASVARLKSSPEEKKRLLVDLNKILKHMEIINEIEVKSIEETPPGC